MRIELEKECRSLFRQKMANEFPEYQEGKVQVVPPYRYVRTCEHPSGLWLHIVMMAHPTRDKFTVEGAWSFDNKLPALEIIEQNEMDRIFERPVLFRPNFFWKGHDYWWPLVLFPRMLEVSISYRDDPIEDCLPLVAPAMEDAMTKIKAHLVPIFGQIVSKQGAKPMEGAEDLDAGHHAA